MKARNFCTEERQTDRDREIERRRDREREANKKLLTSLIKNK